MYSYSYRDIILKYSLYKKLFFALWGDSLWIPIKFKCVVMRGNPGRARGQMGGKGGDSRGPLSLGIFRLKLACLCDLQHSYRHKHKHMTGSSVSVQLGEAKLIGANNLVQIADLFWLIQ